MKLGSCTFAVQTESQRLSSAVGMRVWLSSNRRAASLKILSRFPLVKAEV